MNRTPNQRPQTSKQNENIHGNTSSAKPEAIHKRIGQHWRSIWRCITCSKAQPTLEELLSMRGEPDITTQELVEAIRVLVKLTRLIESRSKDAFHHHGLLRNEPAELLAKDVIQRLEAITLIVQTLTYWDAMQNNIGSKVAKKGLN